MSPHETAICSAHRLHGSGIGKGMAGMACLCSVPSELQLGGPEGWEWLDSWGPESSEVSSFTHLTPGPRQMTGRATCGLLVWLGFLEHGSLKVSGLLTQAQLLRGKGRNCLTF